MPRRAPTTDEVSGGNALRPDEGVAGRGPDVKCSAISTFVSVGMGLVAASAGAVFAVAVLLWARARTSPRRQRFFAVVAAVLVALVSGAVAFAIYVESLGDRCFGPCG